MKNTFIILTLLLGSFISCNAQKKEKNTNMEKYDFETMKRYPNTDPVGIKRNGKTILMYQDYGSGGYYREYPEYPAYYWVGKMFYPNGNIKSIMKAVGRSLLIGESIYYDEKGNITKKVDEDEKFVNAKIKVEDILEFLDKEGHINLETGGGLERGIIGENNWGEKIDAAFDMGLIKDKEKEYWYIQIYWHPGNGNIETIYHLDKDTGEVLHKESKKVGPIM